MNSFSSRVEARPLHSLNRKRAQQLGSALLVAATHGEDALGEIDAGGQNGHGLPLPKELMRFAAPSWHVGGLRSNAAGLGRDGGVPFIP